jgi:hypothetical protein
MPPALFFGHGHAKAAPVQNHREKLVGQFLY